MDAVCSIVQRRPSLIRFEMSIECKRRRETVALGGEWRAVELCSTQRNPGDILLIRAFWSASWPKRRFKPQFCCSFLLPAIVAERCAPSNAVAERLEFGFCFHSVDTASPLSGFQNRSVAEQSIGTAPSGWFQTGPLPVLASLYHLRPKRISLDVTQHSQIMVV